MSKSVDGGGGYYSPSGKRRANRKPVATTSGGRGGGGALNDLLEKTPPFLKDVSKLMQQRQPQQHGAKAGDRTSQTKRWKDPEQQQQQQQHRSVGSNASACSDPPPPPPPRRQQQQQQQRQGGSASAPSAMAPSRGVGGCRVGVGVGSTSSSTASGGDRDSNNNNNNNINRPKKKSSPANRPKDKLDSFLEKKSSQISREAMDSDDRSRGAYSTATHLRSKKSRRGVVKRVVPRTSSNNSSDPGNNNNNNSGATASTSLSTAIAALYNARATSVAASASATPSASHSPSATTPKNNTTADTTTSHHAPATRRGSAGGAIAAFGRRLSFSGGAGFGNIIHGHAHGQTAGESSSSPGTTPASSAAPGPTNQHDATATTATSSTGPAETRRGSAGGAIVALGRRLSAGGAAVAFGLGSVGGHGQNNNNNADSSGPNNLSDSPHSGSGPATRRGSPGNGGGGGTTLFTPATRRGSAGGTVAAFGRRMSAGGGAAVAAVTSTAAAVEKNIENIEKNLGSFLKLQKPKVNKEDLETRSAYTTGGIDSRRRLMRTQAVSKRPTPLPSTKEELIECLRGGGSSNNINDKLRKKKAPPIVKLTNDPRKTASRAISPRALRIEDLDSPTSASSSNPLRPPPTQRKTRAMSPKAHRIQDLMNNGDANGNTKAPSATRPHLQKQQSIRQRPPPPGRQQDTSSSELKPRPKEPTNAPAKKERVDVTNSTSGESSPLRRPINKPPGLAARGATKSFDDAVLSPETARKNKLAGGQNRSTSRPRGVGKPTITPEMLQVEVEGGTRSKLRKDAPSRSHGLTASKDSRNGDSIITRGGQPKPPQPKQKQNTGKKGGEGGAGAPPRILNRTRSKLQVSARRMHTTHVTMQSPRPTAPRGKIDIAADIATPKASNKQSIYMEAATPKVHNKSSARREVFKAQEEAAHHPSSEEDATPKIGNTSKRLPRSTIGGTSIPTLSSLNEDNDGDDDDDNNNNNNNNSHDQIVSAPLSPHPPEEVRDVSLKSPVGCEQPESLQKDEEPVAESNPEDVFCFYTWSKARQPANKIGAERQVLKEIIFDGPLDCPFDMQTVDSQSPRKEGLVL